jgi:prepilin-type N-terminal cleavage/methylation domain-containing protein
MIKTKLKRAFTLVEMLLVIAIISILAAMAISNFSNASQDSRDIISRQQLAVLQEALNHYVNKEIGKVTTSGGTPQTVTQVMNTYNAKSAQQRFDTLKLYLDDSLWSGASGSENLQFNTSNGRITTQAMRDTSNYMTLPNWASGSFPKVQLN